MRGLLNISDVLHGIHGESVESVESVEPVESVESVESSAPQIHPETYRVLVKATHGLLSMADDPSTATGRNLLSMAATLNEHLVSAVGRTKRGA